MGAVKKLLQNKILRDLVPINALSAVHLEEVTRKAIIEEVRQGRYIFKAGDQDRHSVYLIEGKIELLDEAREIVGSVEAGSDAARHPIAHKQPRQLSARTATPATVVRVDSDLLDVLLTWDESAGYDVVELDAEENEDWMTRMLQSQAFLQLPPTNIQQLLMRLEEVNLKAGEAVVRQGDKGDYFYVVKAGRLAVSKKVSARSADVILTELGEGACFGEEALVAGTTRNASVTMITDGTLMRLSKEDFDELLYSSLVHVIGFREAERLVVKGAQWLDVRLPGEFENQALQGSRNLPLSALRDACTDLERAVPYVVYCDTGRRSAAAAFVLGERGFTVYVLRNGLMEVPDLALTEGRVPEAEIIPFAADGRDEQDECRQEPQSGDALQGAVSHLSSASESGSFNRQLEQKRNELIALQKRLRETESQRAREEIRSRQLKQQSSALKSQLQKARQEREDLEQQLHHQQADKTSLQLELQQAVERCTAQQQNYDEQAQTLETLRTDFQQLEKHASTLAAARDAAAAERDDLAARLGMLQQEVASQQRDSTARIEELQSTLQSREAALAAEQAQRVALQDQMGGIEEKHNQLELALRAASDREAALQAQIQHLEQQSSDAVEASRVEAARAEATLHERLAGLQAQLDVQQSQLEASRSGRAELEERLRAAEQAVQTAAEREQALDAQVRELEQRAAEGLDRERLAVERMRELEQHGTEVQNDLQQVRRVRDGLQQQLEEAQTLRAQADQRLSDLATQLADATKEHESDVASVRRALSRAQDERENVKRDQKRLMDELRKAEKKLERERQDRDAEVRRLRKELKHSAGESHAGLATEIEVLQRKLNESAQERDGLEANLGERDAQLDELRAQLNRQNHELTEARESINQAEQRIREAAKAADREVNDQLRAEQQAQQSLREELKRTLCERDEYHHRAELVMQEAEELRSALASARTDYENACEVQSQIEDLREQLRRAEAERASATEMEQHSAEEIFRLRAELDVRRRLERTGAETSQESRCDSESGKGNDNSDAIRRQDCLSGVALADPEYDAVRGQSETSTQDTAGATYLEPVEIPSLDEHDSAALAAPRNGDEVTLHMLAAPLDTDISRRSSAENLPLRAKLPKVAVSALVALFLAGGALWWLGQRHGYVPESLSESRIVQPIAGQTAGDPAEGADDRVDAPAEEHESGPSPAMREPESQLDEHAAAPSRDNVESVVGNVEPEQPAMTVQPGNAFRDRLSGGGVGPSMVELMADRFRMGSGPASPYFDERPRRKVAVPRFAISKHEITFEQYDNFAAATGRARPSGARRGTRPVVNVSWHDAVAYTEWLSAQTSHRYRLPTEAEWEYAARSGTITRYWWGNQVGEANANCFDCAAQWSGRETAPVGSFAPSGFGLHDMAGNAREWVEDCYVANYEDAPADGSGMSVPDCSDRVIRGGGFSSPSEKLRVTARDRSKPDTRLDDLGFRVVRDY